MTKALSVPLFLLALGLWLSSSSAEAGHGSGSNALEWKAAAPMHDPRSGHAMVELNAGRNGLGLAVGPGKVMAIGGYIRELNVATFELSAPHGALSSCEIYDSSANEWVSAAAHPVSGGFRWAATLRNGMVLVAGGFDDQVALGAGSARNSSHLYDPRTDSWIATGPLPVGTFNPHSFMTAIVLDDGRVLIAGGITDVGATEALATRNSFVFTFNTAHPERSTWDYTRRTQDGAVTRMNYLRTTSALTLLRDGRVLNVGGLGAPPVPGVIAATNTAEVFDPRTGEWTPAAPMPPVSGLGEEESISSYEGSAGSRWAPYAALLPSGDVLVAGGMGGFLETGRASAIIYHPRKDLWTITTPMTFYRFFGFWAATPRDGGGPLFAGDGISAAGEFDMAGEMFDPVTHTWTSTSSEEAPPGDFSVDSYESHMLALANGTIQTTGGGIPIPDEPSPSIVHSWVLRRH